MAKNYVVTKRKRIPGAKDGERKAEMVVDHFFETEAGAAARVKALNKANKKDKAAYAKMGSS